MRLLIKPKKTIIPFLGILLAIFLLGCDKRTVNNQTENQFDGVWEMEFSISRLSFIEPGFDEDPISITLRSVLTFEADGFNLQIIAPNSSQNLNREYAGNYSLSVDTIIFNATYSLSFNMFDSNNPIINNELDLVENMRFNFDNQDSLKFSVISIAISDNLLSIPMSSFLWNTNHDLGPSYKSIGNYSRIDIE